MGTTQASELLWWILSTYFMVFLSFCVRYFVILGGIYWLLHVACRQRWLARRIQLAFPARRHIRHEIRWSMANGAFTGFTGLILYTLIRDGHTRLYTNVAEYGWIYFLVSIPVGIVGYETYNYWGHRLLHTDWFFRHVHWAHHVTNPSVFSAFTRHPFEALVEQLYYFLVMLVVPVHPLAIACVGGFFLANGVIAHTGYEFYPSGFPRYRWINFLNSATYHNMHHRFEGCNYSTALNFWDRWMGTGHPGYQSTFDAVKARLRNPPAQPVAEVSAGVTRQAVTPSAA